MHGWANFYVIIGAAASTLIGIQFVVMTLVAAIPSRHTSPEAVSAFGTPTVVHFAGALVICAIMAAPWPSPVGEAVVITIYAAGAFIYALGVIRRARAQATYVPTREDWIWYAALPCTDYAMLAVAALFLPASSIVPMFLIAAAALFLLLIGVHNAWDTVAFLVLSSSREQRNEQK